MWVQAGPTPAVHSAEARIDKGGELPGSERLGRPSIRTMRPRSRPPEEQKKAVSWRQYAEEHLGLVLSGGFALFTLVHILLVAYADPTTALTILGVADRPGILISTAAQILSLAALLAIGFPGSWGWIVARLGKAVTFWQHIPYALIFFLLVPIALPQLSPGWVVAFVLARLALFLRRRRAASRGALRQDGRIEVSAKAYEFGNYFLAIYAAYMLFVNLAIPWTSKEVLAIEGGGSAAISGYVIGESSGQLLLLTPKRGASWIPIEAVDGRRVCADVASSASWISDTVGQYVARSKYEPCPTAAPVENTPDSGVLSSTPPESGSAEPALPSGAASMSMTPSPSNTPDSPAP